MGDVVDYIDNLNLFKMPSKRTWIDYDDEADMLYLSFRKPQQANDSVM